METFWDKLLNKIETRIIFYPMRKYFDETLPELVGLVEDIYFVNSSGMRLNAWYIAPKEGMPTVLYCHGQAEHVAYFQKSYVFLAENGYGVFALDYRGHGKSEGIPSEQGVYNDVDDAVSFLSSQKDTPESKIIIWGRSMGGAIAVESATRHNFAAVILESTFTKIKDASEHIIKNCYKHKIFGFRRKLLFRLARFFPNKQTFDTVSKIKNITSPLLICHSKPDQIVDYRMAEENARVHGNAKLFLSEEGSHEYSDWAYDAILAFLSVVRV